MKIIKWDDCKLSKWSGGETREYVIYPGVSNVADRNLIFELVRQL
jgi:environmental stress-induced protein Ves